MRANYITDPDLINTLNAKAGISNTQEVTDPDLISQLNQKAGISQQQAIPHDMVKNALNELLQAQHSAPQQSTMQQITSSTPFKDLRSMAGMGIAFAAPEVKYGSLIPGAIASRLPQLSASAKMAKDYLTSIAKVGSAGVLGTEIMPDTTPDQAKTAGLTGAGLTAATTPLMMAIGSTNPLVRLGAASGLGFGASQLMGLGPYSSAAATIGSGLLGLRGGGASQLAARNIDEALTPEQKQLGLDRQTAANKVNVPLTISEATGSPVVGAMQNQAAMTAGGSKVLYPFGLQRQNIEEKAYKDFLNQVSPANAKDTIEEKAFRNASQTAEQNGVKVNVKPVLDYIDQQLPKYEEGSKIAKALNLAKDRLSLTPQTAAKQSALMQPVSQIENVLQSKTQQLQQQLQDLKSQAPDPYFRASTNYDQKVQDVQNELNLHNFLSNVVSNKKQQFMQANQLSNVENTVEGLHNAKMGIRGIIESQGENAIGNTAAGKLKRVNKLLTNQIKDASPEYADATRISNLRQAREGIEDAMSKSKLSGSNFYDKILMNRNEFDDLYQRLGDPKNPKIPTQAQESLKAMRTAFPDLMENLTAKSGQSLAKDHPDLHVNFGSLAKSFLNKIYLDRYNKAVAELMINPKWHDELQAVSKMKSGEDRGIKLGRLISKIAVTGVLGSNQNNLQGSNDNGTG